MRGRGRRLPRRACLACWRPDRASVGGREKGKEELSPSPLEEKRKKNSLILGQMIDVGLNIKEAEA